MRMNMEYVVVLLFVIHWMAFLPVNLENFYENTSREKSVVQKSWQHDVIIISIGRMGDQ